MNKHIIILAALIFATCSYGQTNAPTAQGTPKIINPEGKTPWPYSHSVDRLLQDKSGIIWLGTSEGVYRYDGKLFTNYTMMDMLNVIPLNSLDEDKAGNIWFGTQGGAVRYDGKAFNSVRISGKHNKGLSIIGISEDTKQSVNVFTTRTGPVWLCTGYDIYRYNEQTHVADMTGLTSFLASKGWGDDGQHEPGQIEGFYEDKNGNYWFTTGGCGRLDETYRLDGHRADHPCVLNQCSHDLHNPNELAMHNKEIDASFTKVTTKDGSKSIVFSCVFEDRNGNMWLGTWDDGAYRYDGKYFVPFSLGAEYPKSSIISVLEDKAGNILIGTRARNSDNFGGNGVFRYDGKSLSHFTKKNGLCSSGDLSNNAITCAVKDKSGNIWFGGSGGLCRFNGKSFTNFAKKDGFNSQPVDCILMDKGGNLWVGTWELGLFRYDGKSFTCFTEMGKPQKVSSK